MGTKFRSTRCDESTKFPAAFFASHPDAVQLDSAPAKQQPRDFASDERTHPASRPGEDRRPQARLRFGEHLLPQEGRGAMETYRRPQTQIPLRRRKPTAVAGTPEVREYVAHGVVDAEEVGEPSEIKEVVALAG